MNKEQINSIMKVIEDTIWCEVKIAGPYEAGYLVTCQVEDLIQKVCENCEEILVKISSQISK